MVFDAQGCFIIVDSDLMSTNRLLALFSDDFQCYTASTAKAGLALSRQLSDRKTLIICDVDLPDMSGLDVCFTIKNEDPQTFFILLAADNDQESRMEGLLVRADNYIDKSVSDEELKLLVSNIYSTLSHTQLEQRDDANRTEITDEIFCALETEVRTLIEDFYQLSLEQRLVKACSSKFVAEHLGRSHRTFQREIKAETGYSFKQLQLIVRLESAQGLLAEGYNVTQVADLLSFSSPAHLSRAFKDEFGIVPSKYRALA
ncbi:AraC family transcriptional regulator [Leucothrix arctica]|uniref:DNA-binding response regulator n=1 Tax=Leucothrix arctica TaxID=1481894 RepID=A0A317CGW2_9GAMM|nr:helix-turn-helix domain-containing protein [Leucothrix arctica]PWQ95540.1 hypothetical protein DKT75_12210 [Leucothrix arctica]